MTLSNISPRFNPKTTSAEDRRVCEGVLQREASPEAVKFFAANHKGLTTYWYWFLLGTCWVSYTGHSDLQLWKGLFSSPRKWRSECLMKPSEMALYRSMPDVVTAYRAHRPGEADWIAYTVDYRIAVRFALERGVKEITEYKIPREAILALFTRRGEQELLVLDRAHAHKVRDIELIEEGNQSS